MTNADGAEQPDVADTWPPPPYWLTFAALGGMASFVMNSGANWGSHAGSHGALGILLLTLLVSAGAAVFGAVAAIFQTTRLIGIALLSAGLAAIFMGVAAMVFGRAS